MEKDFVDAAKDIINIPKSHDTFVRRWMGAFGALPLVCSWLWEKIDPDNIFNPLRSEVQEKLEKTESIYKLCVDMLAEGDWHLPDESNQKPASASVTPTRKSNLNNIV